jgi:hypothetical protein
MRRLSFTLIALTLIVIGALCAHAADAKSDPSQYTLAVHVSASAYATPVNGLSEILTAHH